jgi:hypothetical protein
MKKTINLLTILLISITATHVQGQRIYHSSGGEIIFSGANVEFQGVDVNTNLRFTLFFHTQHHLNLDLGNNIGVFTGLGIRNVGLITESAYQEVGFLDIDVTHPDYNKNTKIKRRSYSMGFPLALKLGSFRDHFFIFGGYEWEWMFHYKQKLFIDGDKFKFSEWNSDRVNTWIPSVFAGIQLPQGLRLKFKYYLDDFLNPDFTGIDFGEQVDYSTFGSSRIWYISAAFFIDKKQIGKMIGNTNISASNL